jgi:predicted AAA+ superfamily ATPase
LDSPSSQAEFLGRNLPFSPPFPTVASKALCALRQRRSLVYFKNAGHYLTMFNRLINLPLNNSFFLFGARGTGKTHLLRERFRSTPTLFIDLLDPDQNQTFNLRPRALTESLAALKPEIEWVVIDEIQKAPRLLDIVHQQIESSRFKFALTGSSARKLRHGSANLLAGRAFVYHLYPLTAREIGEQFSLQSALAWGTLPRVASFESNEEKRDFLRAYTHTYLQEEITQEQIVRRLDPFRRFLVVAAQMSGQIVNFTKIAREVGASTVTVQTYFQILEDTLIGSLIEPFHESVRKRQRGNPKFYLFDTGVQRALNNTLQVDLAPQTYAYGVAFEHFVVNEINRVQSYANKDYRLSYLRTKDGVEIDLIIERPGVKRALVEIKSTERVTEEDIRSLTRLGKDVPNSESFCLSRDPTPKKISAVSCFHWQQGLVEIGL